MNSATKVFNRFPDLTAVSVCGLCVLLCSASESFAAVDDISYSRDIRPILSANCFSCHGADETHREGQLRLDTFDGAVLARDGHAAIVPGDPKRSQLLSRVHSQDAELVMPPPETGKALTESQKNVLEQWILNGAEYEGHWAFVPPERPTVPQFSDADGQAWVQNAIDAFVLQRLRKEKQSPSPRAANSTLLRRMSLDLIGLPPSPEQRDAFLKQSADAGPVKAWNAETERLLSSPHFGEKWARHWLDAARYADSDGFEKDKPRFVWFYRDWVVKSLNDDKPYNQFLIEQLAGDLLPNPSQDQIVATGFLRNSMINEEGGVDPEQFRMEAMFDRMDAVGKAMLGLTIQCAQCHDHKYDPFSQADYYRMFAFLNNCDESQATVYTPEALQQRTDLLQQIDQLKTSLRDGHPGWREEMLAWSRQNASSEIPWDIIRPELDGSGGQKHYLQPDGSILAQGYAPTKHTTVFTGNTDLKSLTGFRIELLLDPNLPHGGPGRSVDGLCALTEFQVEVAPSSNPSQVTVVKIASATADVSPTEDRELEKRYDDKSGKRRIVGSIEKAFDGDNLTAWSIDNGPGRSNVARNAVFVPAEIPQSDSGFRVTIKLVQNHGGWNSDDNQNNNPGRFRLSVTDSAAPVADPVPAAVRSIVARPADTWTPAEQATVFSYWRTTVPEFADANAAIESLWKEHPRGETQLVLHERPERRPTYRLTRGDFLKPAEEMTVGVPAVLNSLSATPSPDRLRFAQWVGDRQSPTTARAIVNRLWQEYFGTGLVQTADDLGTQGEYPSHPELLDWLAMELMDHDWSLKHIHRLIVNSSTYQQSSHIRDELLQRDPDNRLLARGPRFRVSGEVVRDIALAASGLLNETLGGPPVYPPAPEFLFLPPASYGPKTWTTETGDGRYRRALYTFRFRSVPYPMLQNFDTPRGDGACVRRVRSNTPVQALTTLNEDLFVDCSRSLARQILMPRSTNAAQESSANNSSEHNNDNARMIAAFERCTTRTPTVSELTTLLQFLDRQKSRFQSEPESQARLLVHGSEDAPQLPAQISVAELAAWTAVSRVLLNLDEVITKE